MSDWWQGYCIASGICTVGVTLMVLLRHDHDWVEDENVMLPPDADGHRRYLKRRHCRRPGCDAVDNVVWTLPKGWAAKWTDSSPTPPTGTRLLDQGPCEWKV